MLRRRVKIAIFHLAFVYSGGGERLVLEEAIHLKKLGYDVTCIAPVINKKNCFPELMEQVKVKKMLPKILPSWFPDIELISILAACIFVPFLFLKYRKYDIYFGANQPGPWIAWILSKINKKPYAIYLAQPTRLVHPRYIDQKIGLRLADGFTMLGVITKVFRPIFYILDVISIRGTKMIFTNGSYMTGILEGVYGIRAINCPAGAEVGEEIVQRKNRLRGSIVLNGQKIQKPYVLVTNRHFPHKRFEYAIDALNHLDEDITLVISGKETAYTQSLKEQYGKSKRIHFVGLLSEHDLNQAYSYAAIYLYPAPEEDFGMGIIEAMAHGAPVVAWGNAGPTGIITHEHDGLLARPFSVKDFAAQIARLLKHKTLYESISAQALIKVTSTFTYKHHVAILHKGMKKYMLFKKSKVLQKMRAKNSLRAGFLWLPKWRHIDD